MIASTMAYLALVSVAASVAALFADAGLNRLRASVRWSWLGAMALGPLLLGMSALLQAVTAEPVAGLPSLLPVTLDLAAPLASSGRASGAWLAWAERTLAIGWVLGSAAFLLLVAAASRRLEREKSTWTRRTVRGATVYVASQRGPAVAGLRRPWIVLPRWVLGLPAEEFRLVMRHEGEHLRAGDSRLVLGGLLLCALTPWNPISWWQLRRLRTAVEIDCDRRVLARRGDVGVYGAALLSVAAGVAPEPSLAFAAFSENSRHLRVRILAMTARRSRWSRAAGVLLVVLAAAVAIEACGIESPVSPTAPVIGQRGAASAPAAREISDTPSFTPFSKAPNLTNRDEVVRALESGYPPLLRDAGIEGKAQVWVRIRVQGIVEAVSIHQSSGHEALDQAALGVARVMKFTAAQDHGVDVPVWVSIPITFQARAQRDAAPRAPQAERPSGAARPAAPAGTPPSSAGSPAGSQEISATPTFTPFTTAPHLSNRDEVGRALEDNYPPLVRDAGVMGKVEVWVQISSRGAVGSAAVKSSSGHEALDEAALRVARVMQFTPAQNGGVDVPVWVAIPITFQSGVPERR